jgi:hypothetical protein
MTEDEARAWLQYRQIRFAWKPSRGADGPRWSCRIMRSDQEGLRLYVQKQIRRRVTAAHFRRCVGGVSKNEGGRPREEAAAVLLAGGIERACSGEFGLTEVIPTGLKGCFGDASHGPTLRLVSSRPYGQTFPKCWIDAIYKIRILTNHAHCQTQIVIVIVYVRCISFRSNDT